MFSLVVIVLQFLALLSRSPFRMPTKQDFLADSNWVNRVNTAFATKDLNRHGFVTRDDSVRKAAGMVLTPLRYSKP